MFFSEHLKEYLKEPLVPASKVKVAERERIKQGLYLRLTAIARRRAQADPKDVIHTHGLLVVYGDFSGEIVSVEAPPLFPLPTILGEKVDDEPFIIQNPRTKGTKTYQSLTDLLDDLSFIDFAWLIHIDGTILGPGYDLDCSRGITVEENWGKGTKTAKSYSGNAHAIATYKLSEDIGKRVLMFEDLTLAHKYEPYPTLQKSQIKA